MKSWHQIFYCFQKLIEVGRYAVHLRLNEFTYNIYLMYYYLPITNAIMVPLFTPRLCKLGSNQVWLFNTFNNSFFNVF